MQDTGQDDRRTQWTKESKREGRGVEVICERIISAPASHSVLIGHSALSPIYLHDPACGPAQSYGNNNPPKAFVSMHRVDACLSGDGVAPASQRRSILTPICLRTTKPSLTATADQSRVSACSPQAPLRREYFWITSRRSFVWSVGRPPSIDGSLDACETRCGHAKPTIRSSL